MRIPRPRVKAPDAHPIRKTPRFVGLTTYFFALPPYDAC